MCQNGKHVVIQVEVKIKVHEERIKVIEVNKTTRTLTLNPFLQCVIEAIQNEEAAATTGAGSHL